MLILHLIYKKLPYNVCEPYFMTRTPVVSGWVGLGRVV